ncbi:phosphonate C-P lyase system protein PhnG [Elioraea thermophila]|uniref:phosphonate C-P lyase system protein PhnG n=1 Tax=Elioraea thermophila TaxID=2185104 RepID=UPI000DF22EF2|nr:phosphonate C-P lyase system protein PhnG [Elioraea thermophila]
MTQSANPSAEATDPSAPRRRWLGVLARAPRESLRAALATLDPAPAWTRLRGPETGMIMVRGRIGGDGSPFNLGEMTVTRCSVALPCGTVGHAWLAGRDERRAELAAVCDALLQTALFARLNEALIEPEERRQAMEREQVRRRAAATRVDFQTLARMG